MDTTTTQQVQRPHATSSRRTVLAAILGAVLIGGAAIGVRAATAEPQTSIPAVVKVSVPNGRTQPATLILRKSFQQPREGAHTKN
jgi:hypothetical protein